MSGWLGTTLRNGWVVLSSQAAWVVEALHKRAGSTGVADGREVTVGLVKIKYFFGEYGVKVEGDDSETCRTFYLDLDFFGFSDGEEQLMKSCYEHVATETPRVDPGRFSELRWLLALAIALYLHHSRIGDSRVLWAAAAVLRRVLRDAPRSLQAVAYLHLGFVLETWFGSSNDMSHIDEAITCYTQITLRPDYDRYSAPSPQDASQILLILAKALYSRFCESRRISDLNESIKIFHEAKKLIPDSSVHKGEVTHRLASALYWRSILLHQPDDLDEAKSLLKEACELLPSDHSLHTECLYTLGIVLNCERLSTTSDPGDIAEAIKLGRLTVLPQHANHVHRAHFLRGLATSLAVQFLISGLATAACDARDLAVEALQLAPRGWHSHRFIFLDMLAFLYMLPNSSYTDLQTAAQYVVEMLQDPHSSAESRLESAVATLGHAFHDSDIDRLCFLCNVTSQDTLCTVLTAFKLAVGLLPLVAYVGLSPSSRLEVLKNGETLALDAAHAALLLRLPKDACEVLEEGRAVFWKQALRLRVAFESVPSELRDELIQLSHRIESGNHAEDFALVAMTNIAKEKKELEQRKDSVAFEEVLRRVRTFPGLEDFMRPQTFKSTVQAAEHGPVIILIATYTSCDAIIIRRVGDPIHVQLDLRLADLQELSARVKVIDSRYIPQGELEDDERGAGRKNLAPKVLGSIWLKIVKPIVTALDYAKKEGRTRPRIWWCPTGQFAFLPLHAAGIYKSSHKSSFDPSGPEECCSDYCISSYTPTLTALLNSRRDFVPPERATVKGLAAAVPRPYEGEPLPGTVREIIAVKAAMPANVFIDLPPEEDTTVLTNLSPEGFASVDRPVGITVQTLQAALPRLSILHLACHGVQGRADALDSGFLLRDGKLTIKQLMQLSLPHAFLAFLSACETAQGDEIRPDQTMHLAAAMLFVGFRSVMATMWTMSDKDGPVVAKAIYEELFAVNQAGTLNPDDIPYALDAVVRRLRSDGVPPSRWATFVHWGM